MTCSLTSIYFVCAMRDISECHAECMSLDKEPRQRKREWREADDEPSTDESRGESSISIKGEIRSEDTN